MAAAPAAATPNSLPPAAAIKGTREVFFTAQEPTATTIYDRDRLAVGVVFAGPAIVEQDDTTTLVEPGWCGTVLDNGNLLLTRG